MKKIIISLSISYLVILNISCTDDSTELQQTLQSNQTDDLLKTVSLDQIKNFNNYSANSNRSARNTSLEEAQIVYENLINSDQQVAVELLTFKEDHIIRNVYFEYEGEVKGYRVTLLFDEMNLDFTGDLFIEDLVTEEMSLFKLENGFVTEAYDVQRVENNSQSNRSARTYYEEVYYGGEIGAVTVYPKEEQDGCIFCGSGSSTVSNNTFIPGSQSSSSWNLTGTGGTSPSGGFIGPGSNSLLYAAGLHKVTMEEYMEAYQKLKLTDQGKYYEDYYRKKMSESEIAIFEALTYPQQVMYLASAFEATTVTESLFTSGFYNGKADAFRHTLWNALLTDRIGVDLAKSLTTAHEKKPKEYAMQHLEMQMDLFNNEVGRNIGRYNFSTASFQERIMNALNTGKLRYLTNLDPNPDPSQRNRATNDSKLTPTNQ